ncbi:MAG: hypothetical protein M1821_007420 [Bathelium mastoideum]|nr:MAG: hypothetical protein M1821_007420 [Bathelium mastoideum]
MLQNLTETLPRFQQYEEYFKERPLFRTALCLLYGDIVTFLNNAIRFFCRRGIAIIWRSLWRRFRSTFENILRQIRKHIDLVEHQSSFAQFELSREMHNSTKSITERILQENVAQRLRETEDREVSDKRALAKELRDVNQWLNAAMPYSDYEKALRSLHPETGSWLLALEPFSKWLTATHTDVLSTLWIHGSPGCGKTILAAKVIHHIEHDKNLAEDRSGDNFVLCFFFCNFRDEKRNTCVGVLKSLVSQLLARNNDICPHATRSMNHSGGAEASSCRQLSNLFYDLLACFRESLVVIDAIDECCLEERALLMETLNELLASAGNMRLLIFSRAEPDIKRALASCPSYAIRVQDTVLDISRFVSESLAKPGAFQLNVQLPLKAEVQKNLCQNACGNFLWVRLMVDVFKSQPFGDYNDIRDAVSTLPRGLPEIYGRALHRILHQPKYMQSLACLILQLLVVWSEPCTLGAMSHALSLSKLDLADSLHAKPPTQSILRDPANLLVILEEIFGPLISTTQSSTIEFVHHTVREFLVSPAELWSQEHELVLQFRVDLLSAHENMAICCLRVLANIPYHQTNHRDLQSVEPTDERGGLVCYAANRWVKHVTASRSANPVLLHHVEEFLLSKRAVQWLRKQLQGPIDLTIKINELLVLQYELGLWAKCQTDSDRLQCIASNFALRVIERHHKSLCLQYLPADPIRLQTANILGEIHACMGDYHTASEIQRSNLRLRTQLYGTQSIEVVQSSVRLARVLRRQGSWDEATELYREAAVTQERLLGPYSAETLASKVYLAACLTNQNNNSSNTEKAAEIACEALSALADHLGEEHPHTIYGYRVLAQVYASKKDYTRSEQLYVQQLSIAKRVYGADHKTCLNSMNKLGEVYCEQGKYMEAGATFTTVLSTQRRVLGVDHADTTDTIWNIAQLQQKQGRHHDALASFDSLTPLNQRVYGKTHRYTLKPMIRMAEIYIDLNQSDKAISLLEQILNSLADDSAKGRKLAEDASSMLTTVCKSAGKRPNVQVVQKLRAKLGLAEGDSAPKALGRIWRRTNSTFVLRSFLLFIVVVLLSLRFHSGSDLS